MVKMAKLSNHWLLISVSGSCFSCSSNRDRHSRHSRDWWMFTISAFSSDFRGIFMMRSCWDQSVLTHSVVRPICFCAMFYVKKQCRTLILRQFYFCCFNWFQTFAMVMNWSDMTVTAASWLLILLTYLCYNARSSQACLDPVKVIAEWLLSAPPAVQIETQLCSSPWLGCL